MTGARVKPLVWQNDMLFCGQPHAYADTPLGPWTVTAYDGRGGRWAYDDPSGDTSDMDWLTREEAQAAAQADYEARILAALEPQDAPAVAGVEIPAGYTPGPWWTDGRYDGREMGCPIIAARTDAGPLPGNPTRGMVAFASALLNTDARRCEANARLIAAAPAMAEELVALRAALEDLRKSSALLQQNAEGCAVNHYGADFAVHGMPGWLADTAASIARATAALTPEAKS